MDFGRNLVEVYGWAILAQRRRAVATLGFESQPPWGWRPVANANDVPHQSPWLASRADLGKAQRIRPTSKRLRPCLQRESALVPGVDHPLNGCRPVRYDHGSDSHISWVNAYGAFAPVTPIILVTNAQPAPSFAGRSLLTRPAPASRRPLPWKCHVKTICSLDGARCHFRCLAR